MKEPSEPSPSKLRSSTTSIIVATLPESTIKMIRAAAAGRAPVRANHVSLLHESPIVPVIRGRVLSDASLGVSTDERGLARAPDRSSCVPVRDADRDAIASHQVRR